MKKLLLVAALVLSATLPALAQSQVAYRILMNYIQDKEKHAVDGRGVGTVFLTLGSAAVTGGLVTWFAGDMISQEVQGTALDPTVKLATSLGLGLGGGLSLGLGAWIAGAAPPDFRARFSDVLAETDPEQQNLLAAATLWTLADEAKSKRLVSAWAGILTPVLSSALTVAANVEAHKPWSDNLITVNSSQILGIIGGVSQLFQPSEEEYLYLKYQATKDH